MHLLDSLRDTVYIRPESCIVKPNTHRGIESLRYMYVRYTEILSDCLPAMGAGLSQAVPSFTANWVCKTTWDADGREVIGMDGPIMGAATELNATLKKAKPKKKDKVAASTTRKRARRVDDLVTAALEPVPVPEPVPAPEPAPMLITDINHPDYVDQWD